MVTSRLKRWHEKIIVILTPLQRHGTTAPPVDREMSWRVLPIHEPQRVHFVSRLPVVVRAVLSTGG